LAKQYTLNVRLAEMERDMEQIGERYGALFKFQLGLERSGQSFTCQGVHF
jgi:hypothetical protein